MKAAAQPLHHRHAQSLLPAQHLADAARGAQNRHHVGSCEAVLIHKVTDQIGGAGPPARPATLLVGGYQTRLRLQLGDIGRIVGVPKPIDERSGAGQLRSTVDHDEGCIHYTVSAPIRSYSACVPKKRTAITPAWY